MNKRVAWSMVRYLFSLFLVLLVGAIIFVWWAVGGNLPRHTQLPLDEVASGELAQAPDVLTVASYNIGHGQGIKEKAWDFRDKEVTIRQLTQVADAIRLINADIFLLQEVDLNSNRTARINQIDFIKERIKYPYHACALVWEKNYLPFPYWPPAHHIGYVRAANCVVSRFPLSNHERVIFDKPKSNSYLYNLGYIDRGIERVDVDVAGQKIAILNVHLEAWEVEAREIQIKELSAYMKKINLPIILGGDFNTIAPEAPRKNGFADEPEADYSGEKTFSWFFENQENLKIPTLTGADNDPMQLYTFPANNPDRRLDHIFLIGPTLSFVDFRVGYEAGVASDHLPVVAKISYK